MAGRHGRRAAGVPRAAPSSRPRKWPSSPPPSTGSFRRTRRAQARPRRASPPSSTASSPAPTARAITSYLGGPWPKGAPTPGLSEPLHAGPILSHRHRRHRGSMSAGAITARRFKDLEPDQQDALLKQIEAGELQLDGADHVQGLLHDVPAERDGGLFLRPDLRRQQATCAAWKMIGFPGAHYDYSEWVTRYNQPVPVQPVGLRGRPAGREADGNGHARSPVDVVLVGFGWTGAIMAQQLCDAGLNVLALERAAAARHAGQLGDDLRPGRTALHVAPPSVPERRVFDAHLPQQRQPDRAADAHAGRLPARHRGRRRRHPLERRRSGAGCETDFKLQEPQRAALRQAARPRT